MIARRWLLTLATSGALACDLPAWRRALESHWREYPQAGAVDLYKFAHQGILGSEHAVPDVETARAWMQREVAGLPMRPEPSPHRAPPVEPLPPDGRFTRVHLRPFLADGGDSADLLRVFVETANATANGVRGDTAQFACAEGALSQMGQGRDDRAVIDRSIALIRDRRRSGFDAVHHSAAFEAAYAPAYRVIDASAVDVLRGGTRTRPARRD